MHVRGCAAFVILSSARARGYRDTGEARQQQTVSVLEIRRQKRVGAALAAGGGAAAASLAAVLRGEKSSLNEMY